MMWGNSSTTSRRLSTRRFSSLFFSRAEMLAVSTRMQLDKFDREEWQFTGQRIFIKHVWKFEFRSTRSTAPSLNKYFTHLDDIQKGKYRRCSVNATPTIHLELHILWCPIDITSIFTFLWKETKIEKCKKIILHKTHCFLPRWIIILLFYCIALNS